MSYQIITYKYLNNGKKQIVEWNKKTGSIRLTIVNKNGTVEKETIFERDKN